MTQYNFGVGTIIGHRTDVVNAKPSFMGTMQDIEIDFDQTLKELTGQYKMAVDVAPANLKVTGKAKFAKIEASTMNDLLLGQTLTTGAGDDMSISEPHSVPAPSGPYTVQVTNHTQFLEDLGVFYAATGVQLTPVNGGSEATGKYSVANTGTYTFAAGDASAALVFYYRFSVTTLQQITMTNQLMGAGPSFSVYIAQNYTNNAGVAGKINLRLNACRSSKLTLPFKNTDYTIQEFDFQAFADSSNNWGSLSITE
jgi:hypothetical protein